MQAIVDAANTETAPLRNEVIGSQTADIRRDLSRLNESQMGDFVTDIMLGRYPEDAEAAITNSGGLRADLVMTPPSSASEQPGEITFGEVFTVLPFGNSTVILTLTGNSSSKRSSTGSARPATRPSRLAGSRRSPV